MINRHHNISTAGVWNLQNIRSRNFGFTFAVLARLDINHEARTDCLTCYFKKKNKIYSNLLKQMYLIACTDLSPRLLDSKSAN